LTKRKGFSILAQTKLLEDYAECHGLNVKHVFKKAETAKKSGREQFNAMLAYLKKSKDTRTILVGKADRLFRNFKKYQVQEKFHKNMIDYILKK
jgi:site-specific DNA recombinase